MKVKIVIVTGGREYANTQKISEVLEFLNPDVVVHGNCPTGADALAKKWAVDRNTPQIPIDADWSIGKAAGPMRNSEMLKLYPDATVVSFEGNRGTADCTDKAIRKGMLVLKVLE